MCCILRVLEGSGRLNLPYFTWLEVAEGSTCCILRVLEGSGRLNLPYFTCLEGSGRLNAVFYVPGRFLEAKCVVFYMCWKAL